MSDFYPTSESGRSSESYASDPVQRAIELGLVLPAQVDEVIAWLREQGVSVIEGEITRERY